MQATINEDGMLVITPATPLETYALKCWIEENAHIDHNVLAMIGEK